MIKEKRFHFLPRGVDRWTAVVACRVELQRSVSGQHHRLQSHEELSAEDCASCIVCGHVMSSSSASVSATDRQSPPRFATNIEPRDSIIIIITFKPQVVKIAGVKN